MPAETDKTNPTRGQKLEEAAEQSLQRGKSWFFGIGINEYQHFPNLSNAVGDVQAIQSVLHRKYQLDESRTLFDKEATRRNIFKELKYLLEAVSPNDKLFLLFSGHGYFSKTNEGFWVPYEAEPKYDDDYLPNFHLKQYLKHIKARHILVVSDSCFSGSLFAEGTTRKYVGPEERLALKKSRYGICSGRDNEEVWDGPEGGHSPFAGSIIEILEENQQSAIRASVFADEVLNRTTVQYRQLPRNGPLFDVGDKGGQYIFRLKDDETTAFEAAHQKGTISAYSYFLRKHPRGQYAEKALSRVVELEEDQAWQKAKRFDRISDYFLYLNRYPEGRYAEEAYQAIERLEKGTDETSKASIPPENSTSRKQPNQIKPVKPQEKEGDVNIFTDPRDDQTYKTIKLNGLRWMAQNLCFDVGDGCWFYDNDPKNGEKYGRLYTWEAAEKACPPGWRLPTDEEWKSLAKSFGGFYDYETKKEVGDPKKGYATLIEGGSSGLSAQLGGSRGSSGSFDNLGVSGIYWSATEYDSDGAWDYTFSRSYGKLYRNSSGRALGFSCRCVQDLSI